MQMPKPGSEHERLRALVGDWIGDEEISPSPFGPGGKAIGRSRFRMELDGFWLLHDYEEEKDGRTVFRGHGAFGVDGETGEVCRYWFDSIGFVPPGAARGRFESNVLVLRLDTPRGRARYTYRLESEHVHHFQIENSFDDGATWSRLVHGVYRRT